MHLFESGEFRPDVLVLEVVMNWKELKDFIIVLNELNEFP